MNNLTLKDLRDILKLGEILGSELRPSERLRAEREASSADIILLISHYVPISILDEESIDIDDQTERE